MLLVGFRLNRLNHRSVTLQYIRKRMWAKSDINRLVSLTLRNLPLNLMGRKSMVSRWVGEGLLTRCVFSTCPLLLPLLNVFFYCYQNNYETVKYSSRMRNAYLPTISHCIPDLTFLGWWWILGVATHPLNIRLDIPTPEHTRPLDLLIPWIYPPEENWYQKYPHKGHGTRDTHPSPVSILTDTCEKIAFPQLLLRAVKMGPSPILSVIQ